MSTQIVTESEMESMVSTFNEDANSFKDHEQICRRLAMIACPEYADVIVEHFRTCKESFHWAHFGVQISPIKDGVLEILCGKRNDIGEVRLVKLQFTEEQLRSARRKMFPELYEQ